MDILKLQSLFAGNPGWKTFTVESDTSEISFSCNPISATYDYKGNPFSGKFIIISAERSDGYIVKRKLVFPEKELSDEDKSTLERMFCEEFLRDCLMAHLNTLFKPT